MKSHHLFTLAVASLLLALPARAQSADYQTVYVGAGGGYYVWLGNATGMACPAGNFGPCSFEFTVGIDGGSDPADTDILLTRWSWELADHNAFTTDYIHAVRMEVEKTSYDPQTGDFTFTVTAEIRTEEEAGYDFEVGFAIVQSHGPLDLHPRTIGCTGSTLAPCQTSVWRDAEFLTGDFLGYAMRGFELRTEGEFGVPLQRLVVDLDHEVSPIVELTGTDVRQDLTCGFVINGDMGVTCEVDTVGISGPASALVVDADRSFSMSYPAMPLGALPHQETVVLNGNDGILPGLEGFDLSYAGGNDGPVSVMDVGCFDFSFQDANGDLTFWWEARLQDEAAEPLLDFDARARCLSGYVVP